jgi:hypothetical protein
MLYSLGNLVGFQILVSHPNFLPASFGILALTLLLSTYRLSEVDPRLNQPIHRRPTFFQLASALLLDKKPAQIECQPTTHPHSEQPGSGAAGEGSVTVSAEDYWTEMLLGASSEKEHAWTSEKEAVRAEVEQFVNDGEDSVEDQIERQRAAERQQAGSTYKRMKGALNPVERALTPVQRALAAIVPKVRQAKNALLWSDRILTFWIVVAVGAVTLLLAIIPWGFVIFWSARILGVLLMGPHMYFVGYYIDKSRAEEQAKAAEFSGASEARRVAMLDAYKEELMKDAKVRVEKAQKKQDEDPVRNKQRLAYLRAKSRDRYYFVNGNTRGNANIKYIAAADSSRSKVTPLTADDEAAARSSTARRGSGAAEMV